MDTPSLPLTLTGIEVVFLCDAIGNADAAQGLPDKDAYIPLAREALLLLGSAYVELVAPAGIAPGPVTLHVTQEVAWLLRGKVRTGDLGIDGVTNVGVSLLTKLYALLLAFNADVVGLPPVLDMQEYDIDNFDKLTIRIVKEAE